MNPTARRTPTPILACLAVTCGLALVACGDPGPDEVDPRSYYEEYEEGTGGDVNYSALAAEDGAADPGTGSTPSVPDMPDVPDITEDNTFLDHGVEGFVEADRDPESTFAIDVDTGSFGVARTLLGQGELPPPASIRVEEWVNAQPYDDGFEVPTDDDLGVSAESAFAPSLDDGTQLVRVAVAAREVDATDRRPVNVTLVVDRSGSMDIRERLGLVKSSLALLAQRLPPDDTVSVVTFEDRATPILEPTPVRQRQRILDAVDELEPGGSTNLEAGLRLGYEQARRSFDEDAVNLVVLASDGVANVGVTGPGAITRRIAEEGANGIHLVTVGYGMGNYNDHLMEQLADLGDGFYSYVDTYAEAERLFGSDLVTTLTPVAAEARTQVRFDPERVTSYRLVGYENRELADEEFEDLSVDAGELGAGHRATALYEVRLADDIRPGTAIGSASVRWSSVADGEARTAGAELLAADPAADPSASLELAALTADLAHVLKRAAPYTERPASRTGLDALAGRADGLAERDVPGAAALVAMIEQADAVS